MERDDDVFVKIEIYPFFECDEDEFDQLIDDISDVLVGHHGLLDDADDNMKSLVVVRRVVEEVMSERWVVENLGDGSDAVMVMIPGAGNVGDDV